MGSATDLGSSHPFIEPRQFIKSPRLRRWGKNHCNFWHLRVGDTKNIVIYVMFESGTKHNAIYCIFEPGGNATNCNFLIFVNSGVKSLNKTLDFPLNNLTCSVFHYKCKENTPNLTGLRIWDLDTHILVRKNNYRGPLLVPRCLGNLAYCTCMPLKSVLRTTD